MRRAPARRGQADPAWPRPAPGASAGIHRDVGLVAISAASRPCIPGNSDAVWPSPPMPSTTTPGDCRACRLAAATAASMPRPARVSGSKRAAAALLRSRGRARGARCCPGRWAAASARRPGRCRPVPSPAAPARARGIPVPASCPGQQQSRARQRSTSRGCSSRRSAPGSRRPTSRSRRRRSGTHGSSATDVGRCIHRRRARGRNHRRSQQPSNPGCGCRTAERRDTRHRLLCKRPSASKRGGNPGAAGSGAGAGPGRR